MRKTKLQFNIKKQLTIIAFMALLFQLNILNSQNPGLIISELLVNPAGTDSPFEYVELRASKFIDFSITPYSVVVCNNGTAISSGWVSGGTLTYGFGINTGTVSAGSVVYVGGTSMLPTGLKIRLINTGTTAGDGFGLASSSGVFGNGGTNADGIAVFNMNIASVTNSSVPVDALFYGTGLGSAIAVTGGYQLPNNDLYAGGKLVSSSFFTSDPGALNLIATGTFDTILNTYTTPRTFTTGALTDGSSSVTLLATFPPASLTLAIDNQTLIESVGTAIITISITGSNPNPSTVEVALASFGTASLGSDFSYTTQTVTFPGSSSGTRTQTIAINDDALGEASEYFLIQLQNPVNAILQGNNKQLIFIKDNENNSPTPTNEVSMAHVSSFSNGAFATNSAEIVAHDPISQRMFVANSIGKKLDIIDFSNPLSMSLITSIDISSYGNINSVAVKNGIVACAIENSTPELNGFVVFFNTNGVFQKQVTVGALPDMITFNHAGTKVLTANEGQPNLNYTIDPEGSISIIDISGGIPTLLQSNVTTALFTAFNSQIVSLKASGVRVFGPGATVAQDMEPEYITVSENDLTAYVVLQENNAFAYVDLTTNTITDIKPLGFKNHALVNNGLDATSTGTNINIANWPIKGMYMPDGMTHFNTGGVEYLITANEGDSRQYGSYDEETTIGANTYSLDPIAFPFASVMKTNAALGKLKCTKTLGDTDSDGDFDEIYTFGSRSFSIWNAATGALVYDSGDDLEQIISKDLTYAPLFNASHDDLILKKRSASKGPEPEGVCVATIAGNLYAFVSLERIGGLMMFNINNPSSPQFVQYVNNRSVSALTGDRGPEGIIYVKQQDSPNGKALLVLGNEVSSTISVYEIACPAVSATLTSIGSSTICAGNNASITTNTFVGATYAWYNNGSIITGESLSTLTTTLAGNYSVKINNIGCAINSNSVLIITNPKPTVIAASSSLTICNGQLVTLSGLGAQTYTWTNGVTNSTSFSPTITTTYTVIGSDVNNCFNSSSITITVNPIPTLTVVANNSVICNGEATSLNATGANTYTWTNGIINNISFTPTVTTTYTVNGSDINNCFNSSNITITVNATPALTVVANSSVICNGESTSLNVTGANSYTWTNGIINNISFTPTVTTTYSVNGSDINNCFNSSIITITVNPIPTLTVVANNSIICSGEMTTLTAIGANSYTWTNGPNTSTFNTAPTANSAYTVTGLDINNCSNAAVISVSVNSTPTINILATNTTICAGSTVTLTANGAISYTWMPSGSTLLNETDAPNTTKTYSLIGSKNGCLNNTSITINVINYPIISANSSNSLICTGQSATLTANSNNSSYLWSTGSTLISVIVSPTVTTSYSVTSNNGLCSTTAAVTQNVSLCTGFINNNVKSQFNIYPNPFNTNIVLEWDNSNTETIITIYNTLGEIIQIEKSFNNKITLNTTDWKSGTYFVKVNNQVSKIIKQD